MPARRPPPLPQSLFEGQGPLAPGSAPLPPDPETVHPEYIIDAHSFPDRPTTDPSPIFAGLKDEYPRPPVKSAVQVKMNVSAEPAQAILGVKPFSIHPTILNLTLATPPSITNIAKGAVDIIVPSTAPMTEKEWDLLEEAVNALDGTGVMQDLNEKTGMDVDVASPVGLGGKIVISGLLPPPITKPSSQLPHDESYNLHLARLAQLSLHPNVFIKALPPVIDIEVGKDSWMTDRQELERVLRMYLSPSIEAFGTHRIIFGSATALPLSDLANATLNNTQLIQPIPSDVWYATLRRAATELGEGVEAVTAIMGSNAMIVYGLETGPPQNFTKPSPAAISLIPVGDEKIPALAPFKSTPPGVIEFADTSKP